MILKFKKNNETIKQFDSSFEKPLIEKFAEENKNQIIEKVEIFVRPNVTMGNWDLISAGSESQIDSASIHFK